jgi:hypothetical protein
MSGVMVAYHLWVQGKNQLVIVEGTIRDGDHEIDDELAYNPW